MFQKGSHLIGTNFHYGALKEDFFFWLLLRTLQGCYKIVDALSSSDIDILQNTFRRHCNPSFVCSL